MNFARLRLAARFACGGRGLRVRLALRVLVAGFAAQTALAQAPVLEPAPADADAADLSRRAAAAIVGERTYYEAALSVLKRDVATHEAVVFRAWYERRSARSFLRVLAPHAEAGTAFLKLPPVVWRYAPRDDSIASLAGEALREPWLGSGFRLADLLDPLAGLGQAPARLLGVDATAAEQGGERAYVLELRPDGDAKGGRVIAWVGTERATPQRLDWRDPKDALVATLRFDDVREVGGRAVPHRWTLTRPANPNRESRIELREIRFDPVFDDAIFTTRQLLQRGAAAPTAQGARLPAPGGSPP
jgi:Outer membrane lipoprotein-sorting protein